LPESFLAGAFLRFLAGFLSSLLGRAFLAAFLGGGFFSTFCGAFLSSFLSCLFRCFLGGSFLGSFFAGAFLAAFLAVVFFFAMTGNVEIEMLWTHLTYYRSSRSLLRGGVSS
jgi:hypothetical protein